MENDKTNRKLLTAPQLGEILGFTTQQIWRFHRIGKIPYVRLGYRTNRYDLDACTAALARFTVDVTTL